MTIPEILASIAAVATIMSAFRAPSINITNQINNDRHPPNKKESK
jgi:hypothetical protein